MEAGIITKQSHPLFLEMFYLFLKRLQTEAIPCSRIPTLSTAQNEDSFQRKLGYRSYCSRGANHPCTTAGSVECWRLQPCPCSDSWLICAMCSAHRGTGLVGVGTVTGTLRHQNQREGRTQQVASGAGCSRAGPRHTGAQFCIGVACVLG